MERMRMLVAMQKVEFRLSIITAILISNCSFGQFRTDEINFEFTHSLRIPDHEITIDVIHEIDEDTVIMRVKSNPMNDDANWVHTKIDTTYTVNKKEFNALKKLVYDISAEDIKKAMIGTGTDGTMCRLGYGDWQNKVIYQVWTPDYNTKERGLEKYMEACRLITKMAGFKPRKIFN